tara:strand:+ start:620 stop:1237 length:618 start_codon:yes stop_codon:yes gene_type:complete
MKIIISESQYKKILLEERQNGLLDKLKGLKSFFKKVSEETKSQVGLDLNFLTTWGVAIAGFVKPVSEFIEGNFPEMSSTDLALISTGIILTYYHSNKEMLGKVLNKIKEKELVFEFDSALNVADKLKNVFLSFIESLAIPTSKISNMLAYTFLIPILPELYEAAQSGSSVDVKEMVERSLAFLSVGFGGNFAKRLMVEIVKRFKS